MTLEERLAEATEAYHALNTGTMARVIVDADGQRTEFVAANAGKLYLYIQSLQAQLPCVGVCPPAIGGPVGFVF